MKTYKIVKTIVLGFLTHNDSYDVIIDPGSGILKDSGTDIIFVNNAGLERVSHTTQNAIAAWLEHGILEHEYTDIE